MLIMLKSCPRCNGDLLVERDEQGWYVECIHCGYMRDLRDWPEAEHQLAEEKKKQRALAVR